MNMPTLYIRKEVLALRNYMIKGNRIKRKKIFVIKGLRRLTFPHDAKHLKLVHHITDGWGPHEDKWPLAQRGGARGGDERSSSLLQEGMGWPGTNQRGLRDVPHASSKNTLTSVDTEKRQKPCKTDKY